MVERILPGSLLILLAFLFRLLRSKRYVCGWTARFIASPEFLQIDRLPIWGLSAKPK
jgi:hypothetical protein